MTNSAPRQPAPRPRRGFTLGEISIVLGIIGAVTLLTIPSFATSQTATRSAEFVSDLRQARIIFESHVRTTGYYPEDMSPGLAPPGMETELAPIHWERPTPIGGQWEWDHNQFRVTGGISVFAPDLTPAQMAKIDRRIDDGDLNTGAFRVRPSGYVFVLE